MDVQRSDGSIEAVRQAASVQPSTCICYQLHGMCAYSEHHCCTLHATLTDAKASVQYMAQVVTDSPMYCACSRSVAFIKLISALGHTLHSVWFRILSQRHHHKVQVAKYAHVHVCTLVNVWLVKEKPASTSERMSSSQWFDSKAISE